MCLFVVDWLVDGSGAVFVVGVLLTSNAALVLGASQLVATTPRAVYACRGDACN